MSSLNALASASVLIFIHLFHAQQIEYRLFYRIKQVYIAIRVHLCRSVDVMSHWLGLDAARSEVTELSRSASPLT
jgi:hypothetical protein